MVRTTLALALLAVTSFSANAALIYDANVTPGIIFGSGNTNGSFTVDRNNGVELGLRGKLRHNASGQPENTFNSNGDGTYSFAAGVAPTQSSPTAVWSFEWSINSDYLGNSGFDLNDLTYKLGLDTDPGQATDFGFFDPINGANPGLSVVCWDHSTGINTTTDANDQKANCAVSNANRVADYAALIADNNVAQNSWKAHWFFGPSFDPTLDATYDLYLSASNSAGAELARTSIQIIVGQGGTATVPEPASLALLGLGLLGLGLARRRKI